MGEFPPIVFFSQFQENTNMARMKYTSVKQTGQGKYARAKNYQAATRKQSSITGVSRAVGGYVAPASMAKERKFVDVTQTGVTVAAASPAFSTIYTLNGIAPGDLPNNRDGRKAVMKSLLLRLVHSIENGVNSGQLRVLVWYDRQPNGSAATITDVLVADSHLSANNLFNSDRFVILVDQILEPVDDAQVTSRSVSIYRKFNLETVFNGGSAGTVADINSGSIHVAFAQSGTIITNTTNVSFRSRLRFEEQ